MIHSSIFNAVFSKRIFVALFAILSIAMGAMAQPSASPATKWTLTWSDEFNGADGSLPDSAKWEMQTGGKGWGNNELETYTTRAVNAAQKNGNLEIKAIKEHFTGTDGVTREYTSARLQSKGKFEQKYGRFEARIKMPKGQGIWPAFWMLGGDIDKVGWPKCGEIDIMETIGSETASNTGSLHGPRILRRQSAEWQVHAAVGNAGYGLPHLRHRVGAFNHSLLFG